MKLSQNSAPPVSGRYTLSTTGHPLDIYGHFEKHHMIDNQFIVQVLSTKMLDFFSTGHRTLSNQEG